MERHKIQVSYRLNGMRLDHAIADSIPGMSKRRAKAIIDLGGAYLNTKRIRVASRTVGKGDHIEIEYNPKLFEPETKAKLTLDAASILFQDKNLIVINKPAGLPSQSTRDQAVLHVIPLLQKLLDEMGEARSDLQLVHRLDKDTTGCLIVAKNSETMTFLTEQFREKSLQKTYHALCWGLTPEAFEETCYLSSIQGHSGQVKVMKRAGKFSQTRFQLIQSFPSLQVSWVKCQPITGRSHQIRVHLEKNGFPIIGDKVYGQGKQLLLNESLQGLVSHQLLHAASITFSLPGEAEPLTVEAPHPASFADFLKEAQKSLS